jgi:hypothetical protein
VATHPYFDNEPSIVTSCFKAAIVAAQQKYNYRIDLPLAEKILFRMLRTWDRTHETFHTTKSGILDKLLYPGEQRSPYTSFLVRYFKLLPKRPQASPTPIKTEIVPVTSSDWEELEKSVEWTVLVCERTREIHIFHSPTMSHSESVYDSRGFSLGSVIVEGMPCRNKWLPKAHYNKCFETTYKILSGR